MKSFDFQEFFLIAFALIIAVIGHEILHALTAYLYGDDTAKKQNRLSLNPIKHIDPLGTIIVPIVFYFSIGFLFGWAKPVPINMHTVVKNGGYLGAIAVSLAGIFYNLILACLSFILLSYLNYPSIFYIFFKYLLIINLILAIFNLYPLPPLDGFQALGYCLRLIKLDFIANKLQLLNKYGFIILIIIIATPLSNYFFMPMRLALKYLLSN